MFFLRTLEGSFYVLLELPSGVSQVQVIYHAALRPRILKGSFVRPLEDTLAIIKDLEGFLASFFKGSLRVSFKILERSSYNPQGS